MARYELEQHGQAPTPDPNPPGLDEAHGAAYPDGFPPAADRSMHGRHELANHVVEISDHEHGYLIRILERGPMLTVAGDRPDTVLRYLAAHGSDEHVARLAELEAAGQAAEEPPA